eukprot:CAMPEP_0196780696 /NCGR_PEP_ID=MMETSP1104-20130614/8450_1 /TAXON_ID=33652 /ORGANISM="Cafeteria sp., Strain Caron Lab Isolate" /LENGTH=79 /DNA_ID=CAMNT_0042150911 /DNA_START=12 /DNA_END=251 /DNA_ORIENTATION=-
MSSSLSLSREQEEEIKKVFMDYDEDGSGTIDLSELQMLASDLGEVLSPEELVEVMRILDTDGSGVVEYAEFIEWWKSED